MTYFEHQISAICHFSIVRTAVQLSCACPCTVHCAEEKERQQCLLCHIGNFYCTCPNSKTKFLEYQRPCLPDAALCSNAGSRSTSLLLCLSDKSHLLIMGMSYVANLHHTTKAHSHAKGFRAVTLKREKRAHEDLSRICHCHSGRQHWECLPNKQYKRVISVEGSNICVLVRKLVADHRVLLFLDTYYIFV